MIRIYSQYEHTLLRTGRGMKSFTKALDKARSMSISTGMAEVRELTSKGTELLRAIFVDGKWVGHDA